MAQSAPITAEWIAVDWGTTHLRAWAMSADDAVLDAAGSDAGMGGLAPTDFEPALLALVGDWLGAGTTPVLACGMVGARQGWVEAPYLAVPCTPLPVDPVQAKATDKRLSVRVLPGLRQDSPADVMRGEETQVAGWLAANPGFDGVLCLPGTHSKWVRVSGGEVLGFLTFMTGELFALLADQSVLRHSTGGEAWDGNAFAEALSEGMARPEALSARLFGLRATDLLAGLAPGAGRARLSGLLIGAEMMAAKGWWLGQRVAVIGGAAVADRYAAALAAQGVAVERGEGSEMTLAGLIAARHALEPMP